MKLQLAYGKHGLPLELPDAWYATVIEPRFVPGPCLIQPRRCTRPWPHPLARRRCGM
jgi:hypothetical protein